MPKAILGYLQNCSYSCIFVFMETLEIKVPESKLTLVKAYLKELGVSIKVKKESKQPNATTLAAMNELKAGKGKKFNSVDELFNSI